MNLFSVVKEIVPDFSKMLFPSYPSYQEKFDQLLNGQEMVSISIHGNDGLLINKAFLIKFNNNDGYVILWEADNNLTGCVFDSNGRPSCTFITSEDECITAERDFANNIAQSEIQINNPLSP